MNTSPANFFLVGMRSKLFVPANRPELFAKAMRSGADAVCFDLEDSVIPEQKATARAQLRDFLQAKNEIDTTIVIRVNDLRTHLLADDLAAIIWAGVAVVNIPKTEHPAEVHQVAEFLSTLEGERGLPQQVAILPTIESPRGLRQAYAIASADARVAGLQLGLMDLLLPLGIRSDNNIAVQHIRLQVRLATGEAGLPCFDGAFSNIADLEGFAASGCDAHSLGFAGKSCVHPNQIPIANRIFSPTPEEIAEARRILQKANEQSSQGVGAFALDGHMIDRPVIQHAQQILQRAATAEGEQ